MCVQSVRVCVYVLCSGSICATHVMQFMRLPRPKTTEPERQRGKEGERERERDGSTATNAASETKAYEFALSLSLSLCISMCVCVCVLWVKVCPGGAVLQQNQTKSHTHCLCTPRLYCTMAYNRNLYIFNCLSSASLHSRTALLCSFLLSV